MVGGGGGGGGGWRGGGCGGGGGGGSVSTVDVVKLIIIVHYLLQSVQPEDTSQRAARRARDVARRAQVNHMIVHWYDFLSKFVLLIILIIFFLICMLFNDKLVELDWLTTALQFAKIILCRVCHICIMQEKLETSCAQIWKFILCDN